MKDNEVRKTGELVKAMMEQDPKTREDDFYLYGQVLKVYGFSTRCHLATIFRSIRQKKVPPFETVSRARRRTQELYPELRAPESVSDARTEIAAKYVDFIQDKSI